MRPIERLEQIVRNECPILIDIEVERLVREINSEFIINYCSSIQKQEEVDDEQNNNR